MIKSPIDNILNLGGENSPNYSDLKKGANQKPFALVYKGKPTPYSTHTRVGIGYNTDDSEVSENVPTSDVSEGLLKYFNYAGSDEFLTEVNQPYLSIRNEDSDPNFSYKPFKSTLGTNYGLQGMFEGVDTNTAFGKITIDKFNTKSLTSQINLFLTNSDVPFVWVDATSGIVNMTDGTNTCSSSIGILINTNYKIEFVWENSTMRILINDFIRGNSTFEGSIVIGEFLKYCDSGNYHTVRNILFNNDTRVGDFVLLNDLYEGITDNNDEYITR